MTDSSKPETYHYNRVDTRIPMLMHIELEHLYSRVTYDPFKTADLSKKNGEKMLTAEEADMEAHRLFSRYRDYEKVYDYIDYIESSLQNKIYELYDK